MNSRIAFLFLALLNGGWMIFDGMHVLLKGRYFGPQKPGSWSKLVSRLGIDPFSLGPLFILLGALWIVASVGILQKNHWGMVLGLFAALCTLWYIRTGTILSFIAFILLIMIKKSG